MSLKIEEIHNWTKTNPSDAIFIGGERVFKDNKIVKIGKNDENRSDDFLSLTAWCLAKSHPSNFCHEINGTVGKNGKIIAMKCSCESVSKNICEHIIAVLIHCSKHAVESLLPLKEIPLGQKVVMEKIQVERNPTVVKQIICYLPQMKRSRDDLENDDENVADLPATKRRIENPSSAILQNRRENNEVNNEITAMKIIFDKQDSEFMGKIQNIKFTRLLDCCQSTLDSLAVDCLQVCIDTKKSNESWQRERRFRITGTSCYKLSTYTKNKNPNWNKKCFEFLNPSCVSNEYTDYGIRMEGRAREAFKKATNKIVYETGLVVSKQNPWLACSPDGVIFENGKPTMLLEIKCPISGQHLSIDQLKENQVGKCLTKDKQQNYLMKKRHVYYGQVQLGMAVLNLKETAFVLYSSFDKKVFILTVPFDETFVTDMLTSLKNMYYSIMTHRICQMNGKGRNKTQYKQQHSLQTYFATSH